VPSTTIHASYEQVSTNYFILLTRTFISSSAHGSALTQQF
jgi:hypothetical protein